MLIIGYLYAPETGLCQFNLDYIDDLAYVNVGAGDAFNSCQIDSSVQSPGSFTLFGERISTAASDAIQVDLVRGAFYPAGQVASFQRYTTVPVYINSLSSLTTGYIIVVETPNLFNNYHRYYFVDRKCDRNFNGDYLYTVGTESTTTPEIILEINTPTSKAYPTLYTGLSGSSAVTVSTEIEETVGSDGKTTPAIIYHVETPTSELYSTSYTGWTGSSAVTYSTETTQTVGTDGSTTPEIIYHVETPTTELYSTSYTGWTGSSAVTYSTETTQTVGTDGSTTPEIIYHVETPTSELYSTSYTGWTGSSAVTYSTETTQIIGTDGSTTPEIIYHVETPTSELYSTSYTSWTGSSAVTFSTETTQTVGTDGSTTPEIIYHVETPYSFHYSNTSSMTGTSRTTVSTFLPAFTSTVSLTSSGITTEYTTTCPESDSVATVSPSLSTVTITSNGITTEYTTTCPEEHSSSVSPDLVSRTTSRIVSSDTSSKDIISPTSSVGPGATTFESVTTTSGMTCETCGETSSLTDVTPPNATLVLSSSKAGAKSSESNCSLTSGRDLTSDPTSIFGSPTESEFTSSDSKTQPDAGKIFGYLFHTFK